MNDDLARRIGFSQPETARGNRERRTAAAQYFGIDRLIARQHGGRQRIVDGDEEGDEQESDRQPRKQELQYRDAGRTAHRPLLSTGQTRAEEHTSALQSLQPCSSGISCLKTEK